MFTGIGTITLYTLSTHQFEFTAVPQPVPKPPNGSKTAAKWSESNIAAIMKPG
jgi:hypothetical protein